MKLLSSLTLAIAVLVGATNVPVAAETLSVLTVQNSSGYTIHVSFHQLGPVSKIYNEWIPAGGKIVLDFPDGKVWGIAYGAAKLSKEAPSDLCLASHALTVESGHTANLSYSIAAHYNETFNHNSFTCSI